MEAIIQHGKNQYRVREGDTISLDKLNLEKGDKLVVDRVLAITLTGDKKGEDIKGESVIGRPYVESATVELEVIDHIKGDKVINFRYRPKKGYHRTVGHRQQFTTVSVSKVSYDKS